MSRRGSNRLLVVLHDELLNGATIAILRLIEPLAERGWSFAFWAPQPGPAHDWLTGHGHSVEGQPRPIASGLQALREPPGVARRLLATPGYLRAFATYARVVDPDVIHANSLYSFAEALTGRGMGIPTLMHLHDMAPSSWKAEPVRQMTRRAMDLSVAVSNACAESYSTGGWKPNVVHGSAPLPDTPNDIREAPRPFVVGTVGVVSRRKGSDLFVEAAERLSVSHPNVEMVMVGSPNDPLDRQWGEGVVKRAKRAGVRHLASASVAHEMRRWDAFVLPSRRDPFPLVTLEAMAAGLPVVGTRIDGIAEQLEDGSGLLVPAESVDALAATIGDLSESPGALRRTLGAKGRARVETDFTGSNQANGMDQAYRSLLKR